MKRKGIILTCIISLAFVCFLSGLSVLSGKATGALHVIKAANKITINLHSNNGENLVDVMVFSKADVDTLTLNKNAFTNENGDFTGWNTEPDGSGTSYRDEAPLSEITLKNTLDLYAQWKSKEYTITFSKNTDIEVYEAIGSYPLLEYISIPTGVEVYIDDVTIDSATKIELDMQMTDTSNHARLVGMAGAYNSVFNVEVGNSGFTTYPNAKAIVADTLSRNTYTWDFSSGEFSVFSEGNLVVSGTSGFNSFSVTGARLYIKGGGDQTAAGSGNFYGLKIYEGSTLIKDIVPVKLEDGRAALYDRVSDSILYSSSDIAADNLKVFDTKNITFTLEEGQLNFNYSLYSPDLGFYGWEDEGGNVYNTITIDTSIAKNHVFSAKWGALQYSLRLVYNNGEADGVFALEAGEDISSYLNSVEREFYTLERWQDEEGNDFNDTIMPGKSLVLSAVWTPNVYTLTLDKNNSETAYETIDGYRVLEYMYIPQGEEVYLDNIKLDLETRIEMEMQMIDIPSYTRLIGVQGYWGTVFNVEVNSTSIISYPGQGTITIDPKGVNTYSWDWSTGMVQAYNSGSLVGEVHTYFSNYLMDSGRLYIKGGESNLSTGSGNFYGLKIYEGEELVKDIVPVIVDAKTVGLYDKVNSILLYSSEKCTVGNNIVFENKTISYTVETPPFVVREGVNVPGYYFLGWANGEGEIVSPLSIDTSAPKNAIYYAQYKEYEKHTLTFNFNGFDGYTNYSEQVKYDSVINYPIIDNPPRFYSWKDADGKTYERMPDNDLTLYFSIYNYETDYVRLDYLDSNGSQYIDTGVPDTEAYSVQLDFMPLPLTNTYQSYMGATNDNFTIGSERSTTAIYMTRRGSLTTPIPVSDTERNSYVLESDGSPLGTTGVNVGIFGNATNSSRRSAMRFYYALLKDINGETLREFIPVVQKATGIAGLLDLVNMTFYENTGSHPFITGPSVNTYTVYFNFNGIDGYENYSEDYHYGDTITFPTISSGEKIALWKDADGNTYSSMPYKDITLYLELVEPARIDGYTLLKYIDSNGSQYIDTGVADTKAYALQLDFMPLPLTNTWQSYAGATDDNFTIGSERSTTAIYMTRRGSLTTPIPVSDTERNSYVLESDGGTLGTTGATIRIFDNATNSSRRSAMRFYLFTLSDANGILIRKMVPVKDQEGTVGVYDLVNREFYANAGTGTFSAGEMYVSGEIDIDALLADITVASENTATLLADDAPEDTPINSNELPQKEEVEILNGSSVEESSTGECEGETCGDIIMDSGDPLPVQEENKEELQEEPETIQEENTPNPVNKTPIDEGETTGETKGGTPDNNGETQGSEGENS